MLPALATSDDVLTRYPDLDGVDLARIDALLDDASALVRTYANREWVDDADELEGVPDGVAGIVAAMVGRALTNPGGVTQETTGPFNVSYGAAAADRLYLTRHEKLLLRGGARAFTVTPYTEVTYPDDWLDL